MSNLAQSIRHIWLDGEVVKGEQAQLHVLSHGLHYAQSVFEGIRVYGGRPFRLTEHHQRLIDSARLIGFNLPFAVDALDSAARDLIRREGVGTGYLRPVAWLGSETLSMLPTGAVPHVAIAVWDWPDVFGPQARSQGIGLAVSEWVRPGPASSPVQAKCAGNYALAVLSRHSAARQGADDALLLDAQGNVAESTGANLFAVRHGALVTPPTDYVLNGITRQAVFGIAQALGLRVQERVLSLRELFAAEEVFLCGTAYEIQPVRAIDSHTFKIGEVSRAVSEHYRDIVGA
ncbi:branched-chain amino acid transaminase [Acidovorax sp. NCPPB 3576]|uniref:branched-chain amino acid transaminase n=1 Tax=Acidovorax sp. NCPPB 3576 TaxID=2940488 RepID=UPI00234B1AFF|nr:branched-chain amino acid transaminase [Acidovorax sp. NCPPB 3576]WCM88114.1 branched-chain amino acid transaminase [Acidovorax sp. NCPPB 3576]